MSNIIECRSGLESFVVNYYKLYKVNFLLVGFNRLNKCSMYVGTTSNGIDFGFSNILSVGKLMTLWLVLSCLLTLVWDYTNLLVVIKWLFWFFNYILFDLLTFFLLYDSECLMHFSPLIVDLLFMNLSVDALVILLGFI